MVIDDSNVLREYVALYNDYTLTAGGVHDLASDRCDRCGRDMPWPETKLRLWMSAQHFKPGPTGNRPWLCIDCARHFGLAW